MVEEPGSAVYPLGGLDPVTQSFEALVSPSINIACILYKVSIKRGNLHTLSADHSAGTQSVLRNY